MVVGHSAKLKSISLRVCACQSVLCVCVTERNRRGGGDTAVEREWSEGWRELQRVRGI